MSKFTFHLFKVTPNSSFHVKRARTIGASTRSTDEKAPTMRFKLCSRGRRINLHGKPIRIFQVCISSQLEARLTRFLQGETESTAQMRFEDLPGSKSVVFHDVLVVSLAILLPNLPPCPTLCPSCPQYLASLAPLASSYTTPPTLRLNLLYVCPTPRPSLWRSPYSPPRPPRPRRPHLNP